MRIFSIDPGYGRVGFAVIDKGMKKHIRVYSECLVTPQDAGFEDRLHAVGTRVHELIQEYKPDCTVIEGLFFAKNKKTALRIAEIRGCCTFVVKNNTLPLYEYTPNQVKSAITGNGAATKDEVMQMLKHFIDIPNVGECYDDEIDAIAVGVTHLSNLHAHLEQKHSILT